MSYTFPLPELLENGENGLKCGILCPQFENRKKHSLTFALGKTESGDIICPDLTKLPHLAIVGTTGSGKSVLLNSMLISFLYGYSPEQLKLQIIVPKSKAYAFNCYENLPHLLSGIVCNGEGAIEALRQAVIEMERRYSLFSEAINSGMLVKNIADYNDNFPDTPLPKLVLIIDELSEFDKATRKALEKYIIRLVQKSRACGIHLVLSSMSAKSDYITGVMLANLPARLCLKVPTRYDSQRIVNISGAEKLSVGECYFENPADIQTKKIKCFYTSFEEACAVCNSIKDNVKQKVSAIICAAGRGERAGFGKNKLLSPLSGAPALWHTLEKFNLKEIDEVIVTSSENDFKEISKLASHFNYKTVKGGETRTESVKNALEAVTGDIVLIHDGARPYVSKDIILNCIQTTQKFGSAICAVKSTDTVVTGELGEIRERLDRNAVYRVQTPQGFKTADIKYAYKLAGDKVYTDDSEVYGEYIAPPRLIEGSEQNIKLTFAEDFEAGLPAFVSDGCRVGFGVDTHAVTDGDGVTLGGVLIPCNMCLLAHSDGDVIIHALMDALLSAAGLKDIGHYFPVDDESYDGADSKELLKNVINLLKNKGYKAGNVSITVQAEKPRLSPHVDKMREILSNILEIDEKSVAISAGTNEKLGYVGAGLGITAYAAVTLKEVLNG